MNLATIGKPGGKTMGMIIQGVWTEENRGLENGAFVRADSVYDQEISAGIVDTLAAEPGRFHLIASLSCQWSHRALIVRQLKNLGEVIPVQLAHGPRLEGYAVNGGEAWTVPGAGKSIVHLHQLYTLSDAGYTGRSTVPVLWDSRVQAVVSNDSAAIMRAFDAVPGATATSDFTLRPNHLAGRIDELNAVIYDGLANGVYRAGFATSQAAYDVAVGRVFETLDRLEDRLATSRYLFGGTISEVDWRLFPTLVRFDAVYAILHKCALRRLVDYPNLSAYARDLYAWRGVAGTVDFEVMRQASYANDTTANANRIVAIAPDVDWSAAHGREGLGPAQVVLRSGEAVDIDPATLA